MKLVIDESRCKGCCLCSLVCPQKIFGEGTVPGKRGYILPVLDRPERCTNSRKQKELHREVCGLCKRICPDQAIYWTDDGTAAAGGES